MMYNPAKFLLGLTFFSFATIAKAQTVQQQLSAALQKLEKDSQFTHAIVGFYVADSKTGLPVFEKNSETGLAPASCQKVITAASAFELLGKNYRYATKVYLDGQVRNETLVGGLFIEGNGDPTLGSWRYGSTKDDAFFRNVVKDLQAKGIRAMTNGINIAPVTPGVIPDGWIWEDIGNYYGAGAARVNWHENQYDMILEPGSATGKPAKLLRTVPQETGLVFNNQLLTAAKGTGDNAYIFQGLNGMPGLVSGTIPMGGEFTISGAVPDPNRFLWYEANLFLSKAGFIEINTALTSSVFNNDSAKGKLFNTYYSPPLDSICYWFLKKSVNLYGEALVKAIGLEKSKVFDTEKGLTQVKSLWKAKGIDPGALHILDGSGLSPANRVTTHALAEVLLYARKQNWFSAFYDALPEMNGIKMKDGYIGGVRSYTGYIKSKTGAEYSFSLIVNNFDGSPGTVREKLWKLLDILK